jgi:sulfoxide reductase heme-binding subunit YedZ
MTRTAITHIRQPLIQPLINFGARRIVTHVVLAALCAGGVYATKLLYVPYGEFRYVMTIGAGYVSLILLVATLSVGTVFMLRRRRNPVNSYVRRDMGIWAAIMGILQVIFGLQIRYGGDILLYFFRYTENGTYRPRLNLVGVGNYIGLIATIILLILLATSNDYMLRALKGKRWKSLQRFNYVLVALALIHTFVYQRASRREEFFTSATLLLTVFLLGVQMLGVILFRSRMRIRRRFR